MARQIGEGARRLSVLVGCMAAYFFFIGYTGIIVSGGAKKTDATIAAMGTAVGAPLFSSRFEVSFLPWRG